MFFLAFSENVSFNQEDAVMHKFIHFVMKSCVNFQFHYVSYLSTFCTVTYFLDHLRMVCQEVLMIFMGCKKISLFKNSVSTPKRKKKSVANISSQLPSNLKCTLIGLFHLLALYSPVQKVYFLCTK